MPPTPPSAPPRIVPGLVPHSRGASEPRGAPPVRPPRPRDAAPPSDAASARAGSGRSSAGRTGPGASAQRRCRGVLALPLAVAAYAGLTTAAAASRADMVEQLRPGQSFIGDVPPGETLRLTVDLARDAELRLQFTLQLPSYAQYFPANFQRISVVDADGKPVAFDQRLWTNARYDVKRKSSTFFISGWKAPAGGSYTFSITHKTTVTARCTGKVAAVRTKKVRFDETTGPAVTVPVQPDDQTHVVVKRVEGGAPRVASYTFTPGGSAYYPPQSQTKKGATSRVIAVAAFGDATYTVDAQDEAVPLGRWTGTVVVKPYPRYGRAVLDLDNAPGIPLSVRDVDRHIDVAWATTGAGLSWNGSYVLVTGETGGDVRGKYYNADLSDPGPLAQPVRLASAADLPPGETLAGHRTIRAADRHFVAYTSSSGTSAALSKIGDNLVRDGFTPIVDGSADPVNDLFLATDAFTVCVGIPRPPQGHTVHRIDAASMAPVSAAVPIGDASRPHAAGAAALWRSDQSVWELWAPTTIAPGLPSDLNHGLFTTTWTAVSWEPNRIAGTARESWSTSVVLDEATGVTILHYIEPNVDTTGFGILHRRLFDPLGIEIAGSHATLGTVRRHRPAAIIAGDHLYVAAEGLVNSTVTRFQLLR